jgi:hypothetical protein
VNHRHARVISVTDADGFFTNLLEKVETLEQSEQQHPLSIELLVSSAKRYLSKPESRIQLDDLFAQEVDRLLRTLDAPEFDPGRVFTQEEFGRRVRKYESSAEPLGRMVGVLGRWGNDNELPLVLDVITSIYRHSENIAGGSVPYLNIRSYPAVLVMTAYGLGVTRSERWGILHRLFSAMIPRKYKQPRRIVDELFLQKWSGVEEKAYWNRIDGRSHHTPLSDRLLGIFSEWSKSFAGLSPDFSLMFERFEMLGALAFIEENEKDAVLAQLKVDAFAYVPMGRAGWDRQNQQKLIAEIASDPMKGALAEAGFAHGDPAFIELFTTNFKRMARSLGW